MKINWFIVIILLFFCLSCKKSNPPPADTGLPVVFTDSISSLSVFSLIVKGKLINKGASAVTELGIVIDTIPNATITRNVVKATFPADSSNTFSRKIIDVIPSKTFYVRAYGINARGTGYGNEVKFSSLPDNASLGVFVLSNQQDVINLGAKNYNTIQTLEITGSVTDLSPLNKLVVISGGLTIDHTTQLKDLSGLENLEIVGDTFPNDLFIEYNSALTSLKGLNKLRIVRGYFQIDNNNSLVNLKGLDGFTTSEDGEFLIQSNSNLTSLDGIESMIYCFGGVNIAKNPLLTNIEGLKNVQQIGVSGLYINDNPLLLTLDGLQSVTKITSGDPSNDNAGIIITQNPTLQSLSGLDNLSYVGGRVTIQDNPNLDEYCALKLLYSTYTGITLITGNKINVDAATITSTCK